MTPKYGVSKGEVIVMIIVAALIIIGRLLIEWFG